MRLGMLGAGIPTDQLTLDLEAEAASLFCRYLPLTKLEGRKGQSITCFEPSKRYLVLDAGGGTVDITVHETQEVLTRAEGGEKQIDSFKEAVREIYRANGGPWGGTKIDEAYMELLSNIVGQNVMDSFVSRCTDDYLDMIRDFEIKKTIFSNDMDDKVTFRVPSSIAELYSELNGQDFRRSLMLKQSLKDQITFTGNKLRTKPEEIKNLFTKTCSEIVKHLAELFRKPEVDRTDTIVMVGGFSESKLLQNVIQNSFQNKAVIVPEEPSLSVLKGAVIFGHNPSAIVSRKSKHTYGIETNCRFRRGVHSESRKFTDEKGIVRCIGCFSKHVEIDEEVKVGEVFEEKRYSPLYKKQRRVCIKLFTSPKTDPMYVDDQGCTHLGNINLDLPGLDQDDKDFSVQMIYGNTELGVSARVLTTGKIVKASFNLLR